MWFRELLKEIDKRNIKNQDELNRLKSDVCKKYGLNKIPTNIEILCCLSRKEREKYKILRSKPSRTLSGVSVIAVMSKPGKCPHGKCIFCPGGINSVFGNTPQSYTGEEPASRRGKRNRYDPYLQVFNRLEQYVLLNQNLEKIELIIMGGTFLNFNRTYKEKFVMYCFKALNDFSKEFYGKELNFEKFKRFFELPGSIKDKERGKRIINKILKLKGKGELEKEKDRNEKGKIRCVGLTVETRSDIGKLREGNEMLDYGVTRVEIGVQSVYDEVLKRIKRGHKVKDTIESFRILKDLGFKINAHYMLGFGRDLEGLKELFRNEDFRPDMLKIYPCMVFRGTELYELWKKGKYKALKTEEAAEIIAEFKKYVPEYCRIMRVQRDIRSDLAEAGVDRTNLRQYVSEVMKKKGIKCRCIRCREIRNREIKEVKLKVKEYKASKGREFFISLESEDFIIGFCRLRFPFEELRKEISDRSGLIRELHVYGESESIKKKGKVQHRGYGKKLLKKAEEICRENNKNKVVVISGVGVRGYYRKYGYRKEGVYMVKSL